MSDLTLTFPPPSLVAPMTNAHCVLYVDLLACLPRGELDTDGANAVEAGAEVHEAAGHTNDAVEAGPETDKPTKEAAGLLPRPGEVADDKFHLSKCSSRA